MRVPIRQWMHTNSVSYYCPIPIGIRHQTMSTALVNVVSQTLVLVSRLLSATIRPSLHRNR